MSAREVIRIIGVFVFTVGITLLFPDHFWPAITVSTGIGLVSAGHASWESNETR